MSRFLEDENVVYHKFQKLFNSFDIFLRRNLVGCFINELGEGNLTLKYFNDETNQNLLAIRPTNCDYNNVQTLTLNADFFNMKYDKRFQSFMSKVIEKFNN